MLSYCVIALRRQALQCFFPRVRWFSPLIPRSLRIFNSSWGDISTQYFLNYECLCYQMSNCCQSPYSVHSFIHDSPTNSLLSPCLFLALAASDPNPCYHRSQWFPSAAAAAAAILENVVTHCCCLRVEVMVVTGYLYSGCKWSLYLLVLGLAVGMGDNYCFLTWERFSPKWQDQKTSESLHGCSALACAWFERTWAWRSMTGKRIWFGMCRLSEVLYSLRARGFAVKCIIAVKYFATFIHHLPVYSAHGASHIFLHHIRHFLFVPWTMKCTVQLCGWRNKTMGTLVGHISCHY